MIGLNDQLFDDLNRRLKSTGAAEYILSLKELYVDFMGKLRHIKRKGTDNLTFSIFLPVNESSVFTVDPTTSFLSIFGDDPRSDPDSSLQQTAKQVSLLPII